MNTIILIAILAALTGLYASVYINRKKRTKTKLVCPLRANCDKVIHSTHSTTFGIPNEILGIGYYALVGILFALMLFNPNVFLSGPVLYALGIFLIGGGLFSIFLVILQATVIRAWCSWCLLSAMSSIVLVITFFSLPLTEMFEMLSEHRTVWIIIHNIGFILGVGTATVSDILFFRFLRDYKITEQEKGTLETLSSIVWAGLAVLFISGLMLYLPAQERLLESSKFLLKLVVVGVITINGIALNLYVSPRLRQLSFDGSKPATHYRRIAFALGGISIISWYTAFVLGSLRRIPMTLEFGVLAYASLLLGVVVGSQLFERLTVSHYKETHPGGVNKKD